MRSSTLTVRECVAGLELPILTNRHSEQPHGAKCSEAVSLSISFGTRGNAASPRQAELARRSRPTSADAATCPDRTAYRPFLGRVTHDNAAPIRLWRHARRLRGADASRHPTGSVHLVEPDVVLVGGAPGVGKTSVARTLAARLAMDLTHVDDFYTVLEHMTEPERFPAVHKWRLHPERVLALDGPGMIEHTRQVSEVVAQALAPVVADRLAEDVRTVFEGDFLQPAFAASGAFAGVSAERRVASVFLHDTLEQLAANIRAREGEEQPQRAEISWNYSEWLRRECEHHGVPSIPARPWETAVDRALEAIGAQWIAGRSVER